MFCLKHLGFDKFALNPRQGCAEPLLAACPSSVDPGLAGSVTLKQMHHIDMDLLADLPWNPGLLTLRSPPYRSILKLGTLEDL